jgi:membrane protein
MWLVLKLTAEGFVDDDAWSLGASIAYFTLFSIAPVLLVVIAVAGMTFGDDAARGAIVEELGGLMGRDTAEATQAMVLSASDRLTGTWATVIGLVTIVVAITGVFGELQSALNKVWKVSPANSTVSRLVRARLTSLGLVIAFGFVLTVSLTISATLTALTSVLHGVFPLLEVALGGLEIFVSLFLVAAMFAAMYKVLPDAAIDWKDVSVGALVATLLFGAGKYLIALYIGNSNVASSFGAAGALIVLLLWIFYSSQIFLLGAEFTRAWAQVWGSHKVGMPQESKLLPNP